MRRFADRRDAGRQLAAQLDAYKDRPDVVVLALPRGGVPVGYEVARALHAPLDVFVVRKLGVPGRPEYAMGAIASGGVRVLNDHVVSMLRISDEAIAKVAASELHELERREQAYRGERPFPELAGKTVLVVDDGLATGATMRAAVLAIRSRHPAEVVVAVPTGAPETCASLDRLADQVVCVMQPEPFEAVGLWYTDFSQTEDDEVQELLEQAGRPEEAG